MSNCGIEIYNDKGHLMFGPDYSICRIIDRVWVQFGLEPISLNGRYSHENFHEPEQYAQNEKLAVQQVLELHGTHKELSDITDADVAQAWEQYRWETTDRLRVLYNPEVTPFNQNQKGKLYLDNVLENNEEIFCFAAGNQLKFQPGYDKKTIYYWFDVPGAYPLAGGGSGHAGDKYYMGFDENSYSAMNYYMQAPFWGYLTIGAR